MSLAPRTVPSSCQQGMVSTAALQLDSAMMAPAPAAPALPATSELSAGPALLEQSDPSAAPAWLVTPASSALAAGPLALALAEHPVVPALLVEPVQLEQSLVLAVPVSLVQNLMPASAW